MPSKTILGFRVAPDAAFNKSGIYRKGISLSRSSEFICRAILVAKSSAGRPSGLCWNGRLRSTYLEQLLKRARQLE